VKNTVQLISAIAALTVFSSVADAATINLSAGGDLQSAITNAQPGDTIALAPGAAFVGNFTLMNKSGSSIITIRTSGDTGLPPEGGRISPDYSARLAKIRSPNNMPAILTAPGAHHWRVMLIEVLANPGGAGDMITLGDGSGAQTALSQVPHDLAIDRVYIHGDVVNGQKRAIALNSASTSVTGCYISEIKAIGQDSQAIAGWNGPGPYTITGNYLEAAGENLLFGGADPSVPNLVPADITISSNDFSKQTSWRGSQWSVKNLLELKNARRVSITQNTFMYNWEAGQAGYALVFTVRNQDGNCAWCQVDHITFAQNVVMHTAAGMEILGFDDNYPSQQTQAITVRNNIFADVDDENWGGNGYFVTLVGGPRDVTFDHNTIVSDHGSGVVQLDGPPILGFTFTNNVAKHNAYGIIGTDHGIGNDSISAFLPASTITRNVLAGGSASQYPSGNSFPTVAQFEAQFVSYQNGNYQLIATSTWRSAGTDGQNLGASLGAVVVPHNPTDDAPDCSRPRDAFSGLGGGRRLPPCRE
jgi:hypothetical protein